MNPNNTPRIVIEDLPPFAVLSEEEKARIFGAGRFRLQVEQLENREMMSATPTAIASALTHSAENYSNIATAAYHQYLGRAPDSGGLAYWVNDLQHGLSDESLAAGFIGSPEYIHDHGGSGAGWVQGMYQNILGRTPAPSEVDYWLRVLNSGVSTTSVAYGFAASAEREGHVITADYQKYLGRQPAASEVNYWVNQFLSGASNENVVAGFVGSPEYYNRTGGNVNSSWWLVNAYQDILGRTPSNQECLSWMGTVPGYKTTASGGVEQYNGSAWVAVGQNAVTASDGSVWFLGNRPADNVGNEAVYRLSNGQATQVAGVAARNLAVLGGKLFAVNATGSVFCWESNSNWILQSGLVDANGNSWFMGYDSVDSAGDHALYSFSNGQLKQLCVTSAGIGYWWLGLGGPASSVGLPTGDQFSTSEGNLAQLFQNGIIIQEPGQMAKAMTFNNLDPGIMSQLPLNGVYRLGNTLLFVGTVGDDTARVWQSGNDLYYGMSTIYPTTQSGGITIGTGSATANVAPLDASSITQIRFYGFAGKNSFANTSSIPSIAYGGSGSDTLQGGSGHDTLVCGSGTETLILSGGDAVVGFAAGDQIVANGVTLTGDIANKWLAMGGSASTLGLPTSNSQSVPGGTVLRFQGGALFEASATGTYVQMSTAILNKWLALEQAGTNVGIPVRDVTQAQDGSGNPQSQIQLFQFGQIYAPPTGAVQFLALPSSSGGGLGLWEGISVSQITPNGIEQNQAGTCSFLSALSSVARTDPQWLANHLTQNFDGSWSVTLFNATTGKWQTLQVSLSSFNFGDPLPGPNNTYFWTAVFQRAYLQLMGVDTSNSNPELWHAAGDKPVYASGLYFAGAPITSYSGSWQQINNALQALTGTTAQYTDIQQADWQAMKTALDQGQNVEAGTNGTSDKTFIAPGVVGSHAYMVVKILPPPPPGSLNITDAPQEAQVVLRNPWGDDPGFGNTGNPNDPNSVQPSSQGDGKNDGYITLPWSEFVKYFYGYYIDKNS